MNGNFRTQGYLPMLLHLWVSEKFCLYQEQSIDKGDRRKREIYPESLNIPLEDLLKGGESTAFCS